MYYELQEAEANEKLRDKELNGHLFLRHTGGEITWRKLLYFMQHGILDGNFQSHLYGSQYRFNDIHFFWAEIDEIYLYVIGADDKLKATVLWGALAAKKYKTLRFLFDHPEASWNRSAGAKGQSLKVIAGRFDAEGSSEALILGTGAREDCEDYKVYFMLNTGHSCGSKVRDQIQDSIRIPAAASKRVHSPHPIPEWCRQDLEEYVLRRSTETQGVMDRKVSW